MKKLVVLLVMALVMCALQLAHAQSQEPTVSVQLDEICSRFGEVYLQLTSITEDVREIVKQHPRCQLMVALMSLEQACRWYVDSAQFLSIHLTVIRDDRKQGWLLLLVDKLQIAKKEIDERVMMRLGKAYPNLQNVAALHLVDKARELIRSSLPSFDKAIQILEAQQEKK